MTGSGSPAAPGQDRPGILRPALAVAGHTPPGGARGARAPPPARPARTAAPPAPAAAAPGRGRGPLPAGEDGGGPGRPAGLGAAGGGAAGRGTVRTAPARTTSGSGPMTARLAAYRAGQPPRTASAAAIPARVSPGTTRYRAGARWPGSTRTVPGRITSGSGPTRGRLAAYRAGQPPRTANRAAMPDRGSPGRTTYLAAGRAAVPGAAAALSVLVRVTSVLLSARVPAWARRA